MEIEWISFPIEPQSVTSFYRLWLVAPINPHPDEAGMSPLADRRSNQRRAFHVSGKPLDTITMRGRATEIFVTREIEDADLILIYNVLFHLPVHQVPSQNTMTQSLLKSFDPFISHSFTNGSGLTPHPPLPSPYPAPLPCPRVRTYRPEITSPDLCPLFDSNSSSRNSTPMHSPTPRSSSLSPPPRAALQIFEQFRKDATTPELVLKKPCAPSF